MHENIKLQVTKVIKAERAKVFEAWTRAELLKEWIAPAELISPKAEIDLKKGGAFRIEMEGMMRGAYQKGVASGVYKEIVPGQRLVFSWSWSGYAFPETLVTVNFRDVEGGTEISLTHEHFGDHDSMGRYEQGWHNTFGKLENLLAGSMARAS